MAQIATAKALGLAQVGFKNDFKALLKPVIDQASGLLLRTAGKPENAIPKASEKQVVKTIGELVQRVFVGADGRNPFADDGVTALAPYPQALNKWYAIITAEIVRASAKSMKALIKDDAVYSWLAAGQPPTGAVVGELLAEDGIRAALLTYTRMHGVVGLDNLQLSDRVWRTGIDTRSQVERILVDGLRNGHGALRIARALERSMTLQPSEQGRTTTRPYSTRANYSSMRLARSEITAAAGRATMLSARLNPYVNGITWSLSASHPRTDNCNILANNSPYELDNVPSYPDHPHCLCSLVQNITSNPSETTNELREYMESGQPAPLTPVNPEGLLLLLLGSYLFGFLGGNVV